jgi:predicted  nucleic acid-binding Zn-ribbon protein
MLTQRRSSEYQQRENEIYDKIREVSDEFDRLSKAGMDTSEVLRRLEAVLEELRRFKSEH